MGVRMRMRLSFMSRQVRMCRIDPRHALRQLDRRQIRKIDRYSLAITPHQHALQLLILERVDLLMWYVSVDKSRTIPYL